MVSTVARDVLGVHIVGDLEATMAPVSDHPVWVIPNYRVEGA
jgi:hypothetical protein